MCLTILPFRKFFQRIFGNCRQRGGKSRKRPEVFLTPYEMDMIPLMLKELDLANNRFYQMVCYRWFQEGLLIQNNLPPIIENIGEVDLPSSSNKNFLSEGQALKQLIRQISRCLMEKGTFDEECENLIIRYRLERQEWQPCCEDSACSVNDSNNNPSTNSLRSRSFSTAAVGTSTNNRLNCPLPTITASSPSWCSGSTASTVSYATTSTTTNSQLISGHLGIGRSGEINRSLLTTPQPIDEVSDIEEEQEIKNIKKNETIQRHCRFASERIAKNEELKQHINTPKNLSRIRTSTKERKRAANFSDALFVQLGEILIHQFHSTITVDNCKQNLESHIVLPSRKTRKNGSNENENVHERELKVLIWRHYVQMLIAMLTDRARFPI